MSTAPAGWYPHPSMADTQRYWDGEKWTDHIAPGTPPAFQPRPAEALKNDQSGLVAAGIVGAILLPIVGFIIGIVLISKDKPGPGVGCMVISVLAFAFWYNLLTPDPPTTYYYGN